MNNVAVHPPLSSLQPSSNSAASNNNTLPMISTNQNQSFFMRSFMGVANVGFDDGAGPEWLDIFDPNIKSFLDAITQTTPMLDDIAIPITTVVYKLYATTSLWWFYLMYNGIMHPLRRVGGTHMLAPSMQQITQTSTQINTLKNNAQIRGTIRTV